MSVRCPLCDQGADSDDELVDHISDEHPKPKLGRTTAGQSPSPGADPAYVAQLVLWGSEDPDAVRRYINRLITEHTTPALLAMDDLAFWRYARRTLRSYLEKGSQ